MELDYKAIGKRIKIARINADMTQEHLSDLVELSPSHMSNIETGTAKVSLTTMVRIANALSVTVDDLLCDNLVHAKVQFEQDIQQMLDGCSELEIRLVKDLIESTLNTLRRMPISAITKNKLRPSHSHGFFKRTVFLYLRKSLR
jgi:transcriptional regulator with XRE-family HTH domain